MNTKTQERFQERLDEIDSLLNYYGLGTKARKDVVGTVERLLREQDRDTRHAFAELASNAGDVSEWNKGGFAYKASQKVKRALEAESKPTRIIVQVEGGLVSNVYSSDPAINVSILDEDYGDVEEPSPEEASRDAGLRKEIKSLTEVA